MNDELTRWISRALDQPDGLEGDVPLQRRLATDPDAARYAHELTLVHDALIQWPAPVRSEESWEALAAGIEASLGAELAAVVDVTAAPVFDDLDAGPAAAAAAEGQVTADGRISDPPLEGIELDEIIDESAPPPAPRAAPGSGEYSLDNLSNLEIRKLSDRPVARPVVVRSERPSDRFSIGHVAAQPRPQGAPSFISLTPPPPSKVQPLAPAPATARKENQGKGLVVALWIAAAAVVGLGVVTAVSLMDGGGDAELAASVPTETGARGGAEQLEELARRSAPAAQPEAATGTEAEGTDAVAAEAPDAVPSPTELAAAAPGGAADVTTSRSASHADGMGVGAADAPSAGRGAEASPRAARARRSGPPAAARSSTPRPAAEPATARPAPAPPAAAQRSTNETPTRDEVLGAMRGIQAQVQACGGGRTGVAQVQITVGGSGRVRSATVSGPFAGTAEGSCIARVVRSARLPRFTADSFEFAFPFSIR